MGQLTGGLRSLTTPNGIVGRIRRSKDLSTVAESVLTGFGGQALLLISGVIAAHLLGPTGRGYFAMLVLFPALIVQLGALGIPQSVSNQLARNRLDGPAILRDVRTAAFIQWVFIGCVHAGVLYAYARGKPDDIVIAAICTTIAVPGNLLLAYGLAGLQGLQDFRRFNVLRLLPAVGWTTATLVLLAADETSFPVVLGAWSATNLIAGILSFHVFSKLVSRIVPESRGRSYCRREMLAFGLRGMIGHIEPVQNFRVDQLALGLFFPPSVLGFYVVAQAFTNLPRFIAQSIGFIAYPSIAARGDQPLAGKTVIRYLTVLNAISMPLTVVLVFFMPQLVDLLFGPEFSAAVLPAQILMVSSLLWGTRKVILEALRGSGFPQGSTYVELIGYPFLLGVGVILIPKLGTEGMALTVAITNLLGLCTAFFFWHVAVRKESPGRKDILCKSVIDR